MGYVMLFDIPESLSPRLAWINKHLVTSEYSVSDGEWLSISRRNPEIHGYGKTEDDAMFDLARQHGWRMWNEEKYQ